MIPNVDGGQDIWMVVLTSAQWYTKRTTYHY